MTARADDPSAIAAAGRPGPRIVVECRSSRAGRRALRAAAELAREQGAQIAVVATVPDGSDAAACCGSFDSSTWRDLMASEARVELEEAAGLLRDCGEVEFAVASGPSTAALIEFAKRVGADAIIVAGRPSRALRRNAPCAVERPWAN